MTKRDDDLLEYFKNWKPQNIIYTSSLQRITQETEMKQYLHRAYEGFSVGLKELMIDMYINRENENTYILNLLPNIIEKVVVKIKAEYPKFYYYIELNGIPLEIWSLTYYPYASQGKKRDNHEKNGGFQENSSNCKNCRYNDPIDEYSTDYEFEKFVESLAIEGLYSQNLHSIEEEILERSREFMIVYIDSIYTCASILMNIHGVNKYYAVDPIMFIFEEE